MASAYSSLLTELYLLQSRNMPEKVKNQGWRKPLDLNLLHITVVGEMFKNTDICTPPRPNK